jgi:hypothetical protein
MRREVLLPCALALALVAGCAGHADDGHGSGQPDAGTLLLTPVDATFPATLDAGAACSADAHFITEVLSFQKGTCAGYNANDVCATVSGPPLGGGKYMAGTDVVSLGGGGSIVVGFGANAIVDGPGIDFVVFENPFVLEGGGDERYAEPGEVSVSDDGVTWTPFPCTDTTHDEPDGGWGATSCGGINPVYSTPTNGISPFDLAEAGGDQYDLASIGVQHAKYVRIRNRVIEECVDAGAATLDKNGFDLDAIAILHGELP